jgi:hypothetical protein
MNCPRQSPTAGFVRDEMRRSDERVEAMFAELREADRRRAARSDELAAKSEVLRKESAALLRELRERIDRWAESK